MTGIDTSALIPLAIEEHPLRGAATELMAKASETDLVAVVPLVLAEFLHTVTDARRFERPKTMDEAIAWLTDFLDLPSVTLLGPEPETMNLWLRWMKIHGLGRKRTLDTQLAATLHKAGIRRLLTANPRDFRIFGAFELLVPTEARDS